MPLYGVARAVVGPMSSELLFGTLLSRFSPSTLLHSHYTCSSVTAFDCCDTRCAPTGQRR